MSHTRHRKGDEIGGGDGRSPQGRSVRKKLLSSPSLHTAKVHTFIQAHKMITPLSKVRKAIYGAFEGKRAVSQGAGSARGAAGLAPAAARTAATGPAGFRKGD